MNEHDEGPVMDWGARCTKAHVGKVGECLACSRDEARVRLAEATALLVDARHDGSKDAMSETEWLTRYAKFLKGA